MPKKIKNSLGTKVFLLGFAVLAICSILIYGILMLVLPGQYQFAYDSKLATNAETLFSDLEGESYDEAINLIYNFCIQNNAVVVLSDGQAASSFGDMESETINTATTNIFGIVNFTDRAEEFAVSITSISQTTNEISKLLLKLIPVFAGAILLLSALSAFICSRIIVSPIAEISQIAKRMTALDMTWHCDVKSKDEIGVLASSLNTMASHLHTVMGELECANQQLRMDVEHVQRLEAERRHFFAAVSHELKTPLTILRGQIENMMLGYGDYQNYEKYLPEAMKTVEEIEMLVREILSIAKMESMNIKDTLQEVSLSDTVDNTVKTLLPLAQNKGIQIYRNIDADKTLSVNPALWDKALSNIIGNAVRYSPNGEALSIYLRDKNVLVVENMGVSISDEDIPHLFTPFYRTDKSRNRATGGSGLGLYIVKMILDLHGITYTIYNAQNSVVFEFYLAGHLKNE